MNQYTKTLAIGLIACALSACGGGGGSSTDPLNTDTSGTTTNTSNYWSMDAHTYYYGGYGASIDLSAITKIAVFSTATLTGGDKSNGIYSGSTVSFTFKGSAADGLYTLVPTMTELVKATGTTPVMFMDVSVGIAVTTGATTYVASSGKMLVKADASGKYHFSTPAPVDMKKSVDALGGVAGAPATMKLSITDLH